MEGTENPMQCTGNEVAESYGGAQCVILSGGVCTSALAMRYKTFPLNAIILDLLARVKSGETLGVPLDNLDTFVVYNAMDGTKDEQLDVRIYFVFEKGRYIPPGQLTRDLTARLFNSAIKHADNPFIRRVTDEYNNSALV